jgi:hypothetical protein
VIYLAALLVVIALGLIAGTRLDMVGSARVKTAVLVGGVIAVIRVAVYYLGLALYSGYADWRQAVGYALLIVNSVAELAIASVWADPRRGPAPAVAGLIVLTSGVLGFAWAWTRVRSVPR